MFAVWVAQRTTPVADALAVHAQPDRVARLGARSTSIRSPRRRRSRPACTRGVCLEYLSGLDYGLSYQHLAGLTEFFRRLVAAGKVPNGSLAFLPAA